MNHRSLSYVRVTWLLLLLSVIPPLLFPLPASAAPDAPTDTPTDTPTPIITDNVEEWAVGAGLIY